MLKLFPTLESNCEARSRRRFLLDVGSIAPLGLTLPALLHSSARGGEGAKAREDVNCNPDLDARRHEPSRYARSQAGCPADVRGEFGVIDTALPGVKFTDQMPIFAKELKRYSLLRSLNPRNGSHGTADAIMMSGHRFNPAITYPCFGSAVAREKGYRQNLPPFVQLGTNVDRRFGGGLAGYLGIAYNAFELPDDPNNENFTVRDVTPPKGMSLARLDRRHEALKAIDQLQRDAERPADALKAMDEYYQNAFNMVTSRKTHRRSTSSKRTLSSATPTAALRLARAVCLHGG